MYRKSFYNILAMCCILFFGCAQTKTLLNEENESISLIKNHQEALTPSLKFIGKVIGGEDPMLSTILRGASLKSESLVYGHVTENNVIEQGMIIRTYRIYGESDTPLDDLLRVNNHVIDSGNMEIAHKQIMYDMLAEQDILKQNEKDLIGSKGLSIQDCYLVKYYRVDHSGFLDKNRSQIVFFDSTYLEKIDHDCIHLTKKPLPEQDTLQFNEFNRQADSYLRTLLEGKAAERIEAGSQASMSPGSETPDSGPTEIERKLSTLKILLDKGLITQSDYEKKKSELLENF